MTSKGFKLTDNQKFAAGVLYRTFRDLPMLTYAKYFNQRMEISYGFKFQQRFADVDINGYKAPQPAKLPSNFNLAAKKVSLPNMQKNRQYTGKMRKTSHRKFRNVQGVQCETEGAIVAFTPQSQTPKRVSRKRKQWLRELAKQRNLNPNIHVLEALGAKPDVKVDAA